MTNRLALLILLVALPLSAATKPCTTPEHRQFDFWLGDWDVYDVSDDKTVAATVRIESILGDCVLHELYEDPSGLKGESFSIHDAPRGVWHQTWVTNRGQLIKLEGKKRGDVMYFEASTIDTLYRATWKPEGKDVHQWAETSTDGGKTWKQWYDLRFRPRKR